MLRVLFFNVNGSGMGHMNRCLAYARRLRGRAHSCFFSLASAVEMIEEMGFEADYYVSHYWSCNTSYDWNQELAVRFGMMLERVRPDVVVFDGTWPFQGFMAACRANGNPALVWSNRGLLKPDTKTVPVDETEFDLIVVPGELGDPFREEALGGGGKKIFVPPVAVLDDIELLDQHAAREALGLEVDGRYVLFSLGPGNLKDVSGIGHGLVRRFAATGFEAVWARAPISVRDAELPEGVKSISTYPLVRYLRAFDAFVGAAGYNTCCEVVQAQVPSLLVPNALVVDDQLRRARLVADNAPAVVSACETDAERERAVGELLGLVAGAKVQAPSIAMNGAALAADAILALAGRRSTR
jgi:UDP:flavonoid glycosyltransferase YjiC (YdhE family)